MRYSMIRIFVFLMFGFLIINVNNVGRFTVYAAETDTGKKEAKGDTGKEKTEVDTDAGKAKTAASNGEIVATVNGENVMRKDLADFLIDTYGVEALDILVRRALIDQESAKHDVKVSEGEVNDRVGKLVELEITRLKNRYGPGPEGEAAFGADLEKMGYDMEMLHKKLAERVALDVRPQLLAEKLISETITITEDELKDIYAYKYGEKVKASQIVVKTKEEAEEIHKKIKAGADFATLAKDKSLDRPSAAKGGAINPLSPRETLGKAVALLKEGEIGEIIQTQEGYYILRNDGIIPPAETKSFDDALPEIREIVMAQNIRKRVGPWFLKLIEGAEIKKFIN